VLRDMASGQQEEVSREEAIMRITTLNKEE
jgi:hypothetical protein